MAEQKEMNKLENEDLNKVSGGTFVFEYTYKCSDCDYKWYTTSRTYTKCPKCKSENIKIVY